MTTAAKKTGKQRAALVGEQTGMDLHTVIELRMVHHGEYRSAGPGLGVVGGVDEASDAGVKDGSGTHGAGLERGVKGAAFEAVVGEVTACFAEGDDLGVGGGVGVAENAVLASADDLSCMNDDCTYRNFSCGFGGMGFGDGGAEVV